MKPRHLLFVALALGAIVAAGDQGAPAGETGGPAGQEAPASPTPAPTPVATPTPDPERQLEEFVPTEELPAERAVAFPVDI